MFAASLALLLVLAGFVLLLQRCYRRMDDASDEHYFQASQVYNHETWILVCWTNALTIALLSLVECPG